METEKKKRGRWVAGQSGNPKGRKKGVGEVTKLRESIACHLPEIIALMVEKAKAGDAQAARLLLDRVLPTLKPIEQFVTLSLPVGEGLTAQGDAVIAAVSNGKLAPSQGAQLLTALGSLARIKEIDELDKRITQLEGLKNGNDQTTNRKTGIGS